MIIEQLQDTRFVANSFTTQKFLTKIIEIHAFNLVKECCTKQQWKHYLTITIAIDRVNSLSLLESNSVYYYHIIAKRIFFVDKTSMLHAIYTSSLLPITCLYSQLLSTTKETLYGFVNTTFVGFP